MGFEVVMVLWDEILRKSGRSMGEAMLLDRTTAVLMLGYRGISIIIHGLMAIPRNLMLFGITRIYVEGVV